MRSVPAGVRAERIFFPLMTADAPLLPLFPLHLVLFPESRLTLHIFEERYKTMIRQCWDEALPFGIHLYENNYLHPVGCTARVDGILNTYPDGSFDILVVGLERYRLIDFSTHPIGYYEGRIERIDDAAATSPQPLVDKAIEMFNRVVRIAYPDNEGMQIDAGNLSRPRLSYLLAEKAGIELVDRQRLLEEPSELLRLERIIQHLERLMPVLQDFEQVKHIIRNDGYLPRGR